VLPGYIRIRLKDGSGKPAGIIVHATQYGVDKAYKPETWELIEDTTKK
jgi:hypothetical protein